MASCAFRPLPWGELPFCLQLQKGNPKKAAPHTLDSTAGHAFRGQLERLPAAQASTGHPWPVAPSSRTRQRRVRGGGPQARYRIARIFMSFQLGRWNDGIEAMPGQRPASRIISPFACPSIAGPDGISPQGQARDGLSRSPRRDASTDPRLGREAQETAGKWGGVSLVTFLSLLTRK